jgi:hypothetical protein
MGEPDPQLKKMRKTGVGVFVVVAVATIPIAIHIIRTRESPEIWLTLLGAVLMLVLICLYALETALRPIPKPRTVTPPSVDPDADTILDEPADAGEANEPQPGPSLTPDFDSHEPLVQEGASLVEAEEVPTHPPFDIDGTDAERERSTNPDGPILTMPSPALEKTKPNAVDDELTDSIVDEATE